MFCGECGTKNDGSSKYCENCGKELESNKNVSKTTKTDHLEKLKSFSKKQKIIGSVVIVVVIALIAAYFTLFKSTSIDNIASELFESITENKELASNNLVEALDSKDYFVSLEDKAKEALEDIDFNYKTYTVKSTSKKAVVSYYDTEEEEKIKMIFEYKIDGKKYLMFDNYVITKIVLESDYDDIEIYNPKDSKKITLSIVKGSKIKFEDKELSKDLIDKKESDDDTDVYVLKGLSNGSYKVEFSVKSLTFKKSLYIYSDEEYDLNDYISTSYIEGKTTNYEKTFNTYLKVFYENLLDSSKTVKDLKNKYALSDDIEEYFEDRKEDLYGLESITFSSVKLDSVYVMDDELTVRFKVEYTYTEDSEEKSDSTTIRVIYSLDDIELPIDLSYMP